MWVPLSNSAMCGWPRTSQSHYLELSCSSQLKDWHGDVAILFSWCHERVDKQLYITARICTFFSSASNLDALMYSWRKHSCCSCCWRQTLEKRLSMVDLQLETSTVLSIHRVAYFTMSVVLLLPKTSDCLSSIWVRPAMASLSIPSDISSHNRVAAVQRCLLHLIWQLLSLLLGQV